VGCWSAFFFFQAEDGIRDLTVTGVQTCALPILRGARILSRDLLLGGGVRGLAEPERPVFLRHLDEVDPRVLAAQAQGGEVVGNAAEEGALLRQGPAEADGDLHDHDVIRASDAEIARVVDQVAGLVLAQELEAVELRHTDRLDQRAVDRIAQLAAEIRRPALAQRDSHQGHGTSCRGEPRASARRAASWAARSALRTAGRAGARLPRCAGGARYA